MSLTNPCKAREPKVINSSLITKCIEQQLPKGEIGRMMKLEGIQMAHVEEIRLEFMNIIKMDHLWVLKSLKKLKLNNNLIEKIENLEGLIHLEDLDLSFNKIANIENLGTLAKLRKLNLYDNKIEKLENMENLRSLSIFSIGKNLIKEKESVHHLRRLPKLISLNMANNPCTEYEDFRIYVAAFLPNLVYYEYKRIHDDERAKGITFFKLLIIAQEEVEERELAKILQKEREDREAELNMDSFVEYLNTRNLFEQMWENDVEGKLLLNLGEEVQEAYAEFEINFVNYCKEVFDIGQRHYRIRMEEIDSFLRSTEHAKNASQQESIRYMEEFVEEKNQLFLKVQVLQKQLDDAVLDEELYQEKITYYSEEFDKLLHSTWKKLMKLELTLFEQMDEVNQNFERNLTEMINNFIEESQNCFTQLRELEATYSDYVAETANKMLNNIGLVEELVIPEPLENVMSDKDNLLNCLGATHDTHLTTIDGREDILMNRSKGWLDNFIKNLYTSEIDRNRNKILEVSHFLDIQRKEFDELTAPPKPPPEVEEDELTN